MACRKRRYHSRVDALIALSSTQMSNNPKRQESRAYFCKRCKGWHLTSQKG